MLFCASNIAHYPRPTLFAKNKRNCVGLLIEAREPPHVLFYPLNSHRLDLQHLANDGSAVDADAHAEFELAYDVPLAQVHTLHSGEAFGLCRFAHDVRERDARRAPAGHGPAL